MKKQILFFTSILIVLFLAACSEKEKPNYQGFWLGEENMIFEVKEISNGKYTVANINGALNAEYKDDALRGKNSLDMEFYMTVKGDSAYYTFGTITTGYKRIDEKTYKEIFNSQKPMLAK